jgi:outer membrane lipoprotein-sorting protein|tara:strand:+ start:545 stop:1102 length:558 start_codon:yes stop_codon:yes gene_type:complete
MIKKIILIFFFLNLFNNSYGAAKVKIINNFKQTNSISFDFKQNIEDKTEEGNCIIKYPKKIYCDYKGIKKKIIVSNGNSLVIKNRASKGYFLYPLDKTPLELILNKNLLLDKIERLETKLVDDKYYIFSLENNGNKINIFFDKNSYDLIGWQTEDIYQNLVITFIYNVKKNLNVSEKLFKLPKQD